MVNPRWAFSQSFLNVTIVIFAIVCWSGGMALGSGAGVQELASLPDLVESYLFTPDSREAERLGRRILTHPNATLKRIQKSIRLKRTYGRESVGFQPGVPLQVRGQTVHYGLYVPPAYDPASPYPLVVCLHGYGFSGDTYLKRWQPRLGDHYILVCPTYPQSTWWTRFGEELVLATIRAVQTKYRVDANRVFLTGMSNGGVGTWIIGMHHADLFAGLAPMASGIDEALYPFLANLRHTPVYVVHGLLDQIMPVGLSRSLVDEMEQRRIPHVYREHTLSHPHAGGHFFPREELPALVAWFDAQRRKPLSHEVKVVRDATHLTHFTWTRIDATDRIAAFSENLIDSRDEFIDGRIYATLETELISPNHVAVQTKLVRRYSLFFNEDLIDFSKPLTVDTNGTRSFQGIVKPSRKTLLHQARLREDPDRLFPVQMTIDVSSGLKDPR